MTRLSLILNSVCTPVEVPTPCMGFAMTYPVPLSLRALWLYTGELRAAFR